MKVAVLGAGAIGAYVGAALCRGGADVHLIARGQHLEAMRRDGVFWPRGVNSYSWRSTYSVPDEP